MSRFLTTIDYIHQLYAHLNNQSITQQQTLPSIHNFNSQLGPKYPNTTFNYLQALEQLSDSSLKDHELMSEIVEFFEGSIRTDSDFSLFNMVPTPTPISTAASFMASFSNTNSLMDAFGGKSLLVEQKICRTVGRWIGWNDSFGMLANSGKVTIFYGVKNAIASAFPDSVKQGTPNNCVILASENAHYCVEHVASFAGLGSANCWRIESDNQGKTTPELLRKSLNKAYSEGKQVIAIVCCGGTTINFNCEDTVLIAKTVKDFVQEKHLPYQPYLHLDAVIGWVHFTLQDATISESYLSPHSKAKLSNVLTRFKGLQDFDSIGIDLHKSGLAPFTSSFFIAKNKEFMNNLGDGNYRYTNKDFEYGDFRAYRFTLENSRPSQGIVSGWANLRSLGRSGLASYLLSLYASNEVMVSALEANPLFSVLNKESLGWEIVFDIQFKASTLHHFETLSATKNAFIAYVWKLVSAGYNVPLISIVPNYKINNHKSNVTTGFLMYPMKPIDSNTATVIVNHLVDVLKSFEEDFRHVSNVNHFQPPIR